MLTLKKGSVSPTANMYFPREKNISNMVFFAADASFRLFYYENAGS
jgi:hypothetical protein